MCMLYFQINCAKQIYIDMYLKIEPMYILISLCKIKNNQPKIKQGTR